MLSLRHFGLVLFIPWRVGSWRGEGCNYGLWLRRRRRRFRFQLAEGAPRLPYLSPLARARALLARPWSARCYGVARQREGSRQNSIGGSGVLSLRHFGLVLYPLILGAWVPKNLPRRGWFRPGRCCSTGSGRLDLNLDLLISGPRDLLFYQPHACARALLARPWSARCYGVARQREGSRQNSIGWVARVYLICYP